MMQWLKPVWNEYSPSKWKSHWHSSCIRGVDEQCTGDSDCRQFWVHPFAHKVSSISLESRSIFPGISTGDNYPPPATTVCCARTGGSFAAPPLGLPSPEGIIYTVSSDKQHWEWPRSGLPDWDPDGCKATARGGGEEEPLNTDLTLQHISSKQADVLTAFITFRL